MAVGVEKDQPSSALALSNALPDVAVADILVPEPYVWPKEALAHVAHDAYADGDAIPVIDLHGDLDETRRGELCDRIRGACATSASSKS